MYRGSTITFSILSFLFFFFANQGKALTQPTLLSGTINAYGEVAGVDTTTNMVTVTDPAFAAGLALNDLVMIYQTQGASISSGAVNPNFGDLTSINGAGSFEFGRVCSINGTDIAIENKLLNTYYDPSVSDASIQIITVPEYADAEVVALTAADWDGNSGGILALSVLDTLYVNGIIDVSRKGFRGGEAIRNTADQCSFAILASDFAYPSAIGPQQVGGKKGEGIAAYIPGQEYGRGPQANGGGGGNGHNTGGAGGGNGGIGGDGGERVVTGFFQCKGTRPGISGNSLLASGYSAASQRAFLGGGGGAGEDNNGQADNGGDGGGLVIIIANVITGNGTIRANGGAVVFGGSDGNSGGGAGGSILLNANVINGAGLTIEATGGNGGNTTINCEGPGGGGAGGVIWSSVGLGGATTSVIGGTAGQAQACGNSPQGASNGGAGQVITTGLAPPQGTNPVPCILEAAVRLNSFSQGNQARLSWEYGNATVQSWQLEQHGSISGWNEIRSFSSDKQSVVIPLKTETQLLRIRATNSDGSYTYSNQILLNERRMEGLQASVQISNQETSLLLEGLTPSLPVAISIYDLQGRRLRQRTLEVIQPTQRIELSDLVIPEGVYMMTVYHAGESETLRLLILR